MSFLSSFYPQPVVPNAIEVTASGSDTARTLSDRFGEVFHVDDFGAKGDGVTDDRAAIQDAVNAAVAANGGTIRFSANKTYLIDSVTSRTDPVGFPTPVFGFAVGSGNTISGFGSSTMRLFFDGNNATIRLTKGPPLNGSVICYVCCRFSYIGFENLRFIRDRYFITGSGAQATGVSFWAYDTNTHDHVSFNNCYFNNCHHSISFHATRRVNYLAVRGKLKQVDITNCTFDHPYGAGRPANFNTALHGWSGALVINGDTWIDVANFENCYADGMNGGVLPIENFDTMHGFLFPMPLKTNIRNCYFKHMSVEVIKASDGENANVGITLDGNFTQPAVGSTMTRTVVSNNEGLQTMTIGGIYSFIDGNYFAGRIGIYRLDTAPNYNVGTQLIFTRLSSDLYDMPSARDLAAANFGNISPIDMATLDKMSLQVTGCIFDASEPITYQLPSPATGGQRWDYPSILCDYELIVSNNMFVGGVSNVYCGSTAANHKQTVITGNTFYTFSITNLQSEGNTQFIEMRKSNVLISNNSFVVKESRALSSAIGVGGHEILISNNLIIVQQPSTFNSGGVNQTEPVFILERNGGPWRIVAQDNYLRDMGHYVFANHTPHVGSFYGNILSTIGRNDGGTVTTFRTGKPFRSANGQTWYMNITNDGEIETFQ